MNRDRTVKIALGETTIGIRCQDGAFMDRLRLDYQPFLASHQPDLWIEFSLTGSYMVHEINTLLTQLQTFYDTDRFTTEPKLVECRIHWARDLVWVEAEREIFAPGVRYRLMNTLLRGIYYAIYKRKWHSSPDAYLVHGCGILSDTRGYLFTGPSGVGKTTVARLAEGRTVLNDEAVLVGRNGSGFFVAGTPLDGQVPQRSGAKIDLSAVLMLKHDTEVSLRKLSRAEAFRSFLSQTFEASPLLDNSGIGSLPERADLSAAVAGGVPFYELSFRPDTSFWSAVESI